ncbi:MAG: signal recognition particle-docking protein FtsY [Pseudomonadota bacterium]
MLGRLKDSLAKTRNGLVGKVKELFSAGATIDQAVIDDLETSLIAADVGVAASQQIIAAVQAAKANESPVEHIKQTLVKLLAPVEAAFAIPETHEGPFVILVIGVNGAGKTTTIAKLARQFQKQGLSVLLAAGDTFRAAAREQLETWGERLAIPVVAQDTGADPASVLYDACAAAKARDLDVVIADTAGRLHSHSHLMEELTKISRVVAKAVPNAPHEVLLVLDGTMGQNALAQARQFNEAVPLSGLCVTKLDGTAKGGMVFALGEALGVPIRFLGLGEGADDLQPFVATQFVEALLSDLENSTDD